MVGFMNEEALRKTVETGFATFYSRSRKKLWLKGESSGHRLVVKEISTDCDQDAVLVKVEAIGPGVCHEGYESCFFRRLEDGEWNESEAKTYDPKAVYKADETPTRHSEGQPRERDRRSVPPRRLQHHHQQPLLLPGDRRSGDRVHADPRAGDGALCGRRHSRCRPHRSRLGGRKRSAGRNDRRSDLRQAELRQSALGAGRAGVLSVSHREGSGGQDHRDRAGRRPRSAIWHATASRRKSSSVGARRK